MNENEVREMETIESENTNTYDECESSGGGSLATVLVGAALFAGGVAVSKIAGAIKNRKKDDKPKKKRKKFVCGWVEVDDEVFEELAPEEDIFEEEDLEPETEEK